VYIGTGKFSSGDVNLVDWVCHFWYQYLRHSMFLVECSGMDGRGRYTFLYQLRFELIDLTYDIHLLLEYIFSTDEIYSTR
jgi:hypothetical protein